MRAVHPVHRNLFGLVCAVAVSGCHAAPVDFGREPHMTPVIPVETGVLQPGRSRPEYAALVEPRMSKQSTWSDRSADLFRDARAIKPGDILTVKISIKDKATFDSTSNRSRDAKYDSQGKLNFGLDAFGAKRVGQAAVDANTSANTSTEGKGGVTRSESIDLLVAATVTAILPNGNLVVRGSQEVRVNFEVRVLEVAGIVRPRDIATDNSVSYEKIAEARIAYGGRGRIMEVMQPGKGQQLIDWLSPF